MSQITKEMSIEGLPIGTGAAIGSFLRTLYMTAAPRYAIIGMEVCNGTLFDKLANNTTMVSDVVMLFTGYDYALVDSEVERGEVVSGSRGSNECIYQLSYTLERKISEISTDLFGAYHSAHPRSIKLAAPIDNFSITFYVRRVTGIFKKTEAQAALSEVSSSSPIIPIAAMSLRTTKVYSTLKTSTFTEDVTLHISGDDTEIEADIEALCQVWQKYSTKVSNALDSLHEIHAVT